MCRSVLLLLACLCAGLPVRGDCPGSSVDPAPVAALVSAPDLKALDAVYQTIDHKHPALAAIYYRRRLALNPTRSEEIRYLKSLPRTQEELDRVYDLTLTPQVCENAVVSDVVYGMFQIAGKLVRRHGIMHGRFIELCLFANAEVGEIAWSEFDTLLEEDPLLTLAAMRELPPDAKARLCGGSDPAHMSVREAIRRCQSEM
jgi:hypothetical protein